MKKLILTLTILVPLISQADIKCTSPQFVGGPAIFSILNATTQSQISWSVAEIDGETFKKLEEVIQLIESSFKKERIMKIDFTLNKSNCVVAKTEPLLHSCNLGIMGEVGKIEDITLSLRSGRKLVVQAIPNIQTHIVQYLEADKKGEIMSYSQVHARLFLEFHPVGSKTLYVVINDMRPGALGGCL